MRLIHNVVISAFAKPEEDVEEVKRGVTDLVPFNIEDEKIKLNVQKAFGFNERIIRIFKITLSKQQHIRAFIIFLKEKLGKNQCIKLLSQKESRLDQEELSFFIRIGKDQWLEDKRMILTDSGYCFHMKLALAAYPARRDIGLSVVEKLFE